MAAIKQVDHTGQNFPSFKAMCEHWEKKPATVKRRLNNSFHPWPLEMALEIPEIPGYKYKLVKIDTTKTLYFEVKIEPNYVQYEKFNEKWMTFPDIKKNFPKNMAQLQKGRLLGVY